MRKLTKLLMFAVLALGVSFSACNNQDIPDGPDQGKGNTHVSVTLKMSQNGTKAGNDHGNNLIGEWAGNDIVNTISIYLVDGASVTRRQFTVGKEYDVNGNGVYVPNIDAAIKTTAGMKRVYVVVNETGPVQKWLAKSSVQEFEQNYENIALFLENSGTSETVSTSAINLAYTKDVDGRSKDAIVMTNLNFGEIDVLDNISEDETIGAAVGNKDFNRVSLTVQRAVARAMVTIAGAEGATDVTFKVPNTSANNGMSVLGELSEITWAVAQGENSLYVQQKESLETPWYAWKPSVNEDFFSLGTEPTAAQKYDYSGLFEKGNANRNYNGTLIPTLASYSKDRTDDNAGVIAEENFMGGKFVLPTTHEFADAPTIGANKDAYQGGYQKGNTAYVLVRATFEPVKEAFVDAGGANYKKGQTFFVSEGKFYTSAQAVYDATGSTQMTKYENAKVLYYAWLNPDVVSAPYNSPTLRNSIYHIHITGFKNIGTNWNPLYPEDPDNFVPPFTPNPKYDPTEEPTIGTNPPVIINPEYDAENNPNVPPFIPNPNYDPEEPSIPGSNDPFIPNENYDPKNPPKNPDPRPTPDPIVPGDGEKPEIPTEPINPIDPEDPLTTSETWMSVDVSILPWKVHSYEIDLGI